MSIRPHDVTDLYLSPVALALDHRLAEYDNLSQDDVEYRVVLSTNREPRDAAERSELVLGSLTHSLETHGWEVSWAARGLQMRHGEHVMVLGVPESLREYLAAKDLT